MLKTIQKMSNSHQRCSNSDIFRINAKTCTFRYLVEFFQMNPTQIIIARFLLHWIFLFHPHRTLSRVAAPPREKLSINILDTERYCRRYQEEGHSCAEDRKCLRGFRHDVQASCRHQAHCLRRSRVWATGGK